MIKAGMTVKEAAREWVNGFSKFPQDMIGKLMAMDADAWQELTMPKLCDRVCVTTLPENCESEECSGEITNLISECDLYQITLDDGTIIEISAEDFEVERDDSLPMWGWLWQFGDSADDYWLSNMGGIKLMSRCGLRVYEHDEWGYFFGIDGAGYDFYDEHWCPLYKARGL